MNEPNAVDRYIRWNPKTNLFEPVWWRRDVLPFWLFPDEQYYPNGFFTINAVPTATPPIVYRLPHASLDMDNGVGNPLRITDFVFEDSTDTTALASWTITMKDMGEQMQFMNAPIHIRTFAGTSQLPAKCFEPLFLPSRHALMMTVDKISFGAVTARLYGVGELYCTWSPNMERYPADARVMNALVQKYLERRKYIQPYWCTTDGGCLQVPAGMTIETDMTIGDDAHFEASHILAVAVDPRYQITLFNPLTRQTIVNGTIDGSMLGDAFNPQPFPATFVIPAGETIRVRITDLSNSDNIVWLTLRGRKIKAPLKNIADVKAQLEVNQTKVAQQVQKAG
jgi:hypothetical protein